MPNATLKEAIKEAYASAPSDEVLLHTLELRHPAFMDGTALRVVRDNVELEATLEADSNGNRQTVKFEPFGFDISLPQVVDRSSPKATLTIDNVSREIVRNIELAAETQEVIKVTYRPYLSSDKSGPQYDPPLTMTLTEIVATVLSVRGSLTLPKLGNHKFPGEVYTFQRFPGLLR